MKHLNSFKLTLLAASIISAPMVFAGMTNGDAPNANSVNQNEMHKKTTQEHSHTTEIKETQQKTNALDATHYAGIAIVSFKENSTALSKSSKQTLKVIAEGLEKDVPTELVIDVTESINPAQDPVAEQGNDAAESNSTKDFPQNQPMVSANQQNTGKQNAISAEMTKNRAERVKTYLEGRGVEVIEMSMESAEDPNSTKPDANDEKNISSEKVQKVRVVITEESAKDRFSSL